MKQKLLSVLSIALIFNGLSLFGQDEKKSEEKVKQGWNFGALPAVTYNTDLGFQYGGLVNFFNYGDGSQYPDYLHNIYIEVSRFTKGSGIYRLSYDSEYLIPGVRVTSDLAYLPDMAFNFFGFNGYEAVYNASWAEDQSDAYKTRMFYKLKNNTFRFKTDIQFPLAGDKFLALVGFNLQQYNISTVDIDRLNRGKENNLLPDTETLYDHYVDWGIIGDDEKDGGFIPLLKAGVVYDSRDNEANPMHGVWTEVFIFGAPDFLGAESGFAKFNVTHRQYFTLIERDLSLAYRVGYQGTLSGKVPFYYQWQIETSKMKDQIGLGGSKTLRGIQRARIIGDGFFYGNVEMRWKAIHFNWINQRFYIGLNAFTDFGQVIQKVDVKSKIALLNTPIPEGYFNFDNGESMHVSYGLGLRIAMNENFVIAADYGRALDPQDGISGFYIGLDYLF